MSTPYGIRDFTRITGVDATSTGDTLMLRPIIPIDILRWGFISTVLVDVGAGMTISIDHRPTIGSDTDRAEIGAITSTVDVAVGKGQFDDIANAVAQATGVDGSLVDVAPAGPFEVDPGEEIIFDVDDAADTGGTMEVWIEYFVKPFVGSRVTTNLTDVGYRRLIYVPLWSI